MDEATSVAISPEQIGGASVLDQKMKKSPGKLGLAIFGVVLLGGLGYAGSQLAHDLSSTHLISAWPYVLLGVALLIALAFEFVNGFHDTANAVATVIYTHSLEPHIAVVWSGMWNLIGVLTSSGAVAFAILSLLPVELILQVGKGAGFAMVFSLLISAILWNLATWWLGLPASSSHTLIGSIIGVGIANQLMSVKSGTSGVDWGQAGSVFKALLVSPLVGFGFAAILLLILKFVIRDPALYQSPKGNEPPPFWIRCLLILTCTGVSFGHGSNDGQKGMGLIMLILIGTVPTAYALNHAVGYRAVQDFGAVSEQAANVFNHYVDQNAVIGDARTDLTDYIRTKDFTPNTMLAARQMASEIGHEVEQYKTLAAVPADQQQNVRNDMYIESEALRLIAKAGNPAFTADENKVLTNYKKHLDGATRFIPGWVKVAVALALGLGTMVGWKRIVVTVGEKIGKEHLTYAQGASAEIVAAITIIAADQYHLPVSTTHVLSSGVAGTMMANGSGLQLATIRNIALAWVFTLPAAALLAGGLFWAMRQFV
ncbi:inorganic phosphate transporter [Paracidobacterium acidisoli]|uniref:Phosphate transporter n=1 Tax=Paracidobacterium acidisoli TaxID=2303751 RepID=A0A372IQB2_9BACT|nr:inorganic phosphate transporter [Paracidobacterium acidisoli]MBT9331279.1 inorganic phosphate transporter [Paracidobacterium acidisoli]